MAKPYNKCWFLYGRCMVNGHNGCKPPEFDFSGAVDDTSVDGFDIAILVGVM